MKWYLLITPVHNYVSVNSQRLQEGRQVCQFMPLPHHPRLAPMWPLPASQHPHLQPGAGHMVVTMVTRVARSPHPHLVLSTHRLLQVPMGASKLDTGHQLAIQPRSLATLPSLHTTLLGSRNTAGASRLRHLTVTSLGHPAMGVSIPQVASHSPIMGSRKTALVPVMLQHLAKILALHMVK
ncbi:hypothetical protein DPMN_124480 [Dreissena polymorpha]|uniref:Uncharacterized protein n=1 Tax=Dreissena polymorpha TaxID=45954 RepID=A0A9D4GW45_DREPO|nr:hypothetical protein DPMN_124480 [Dreissena polymorpha]